MTALNTQPRKGLFYVSPEVYTDNRIYQDEVNRIYKGESWNYLGLECEIKNPGDFVQTFIGDIPVVVVRNKEQQVSAFVNRCTHRGAKVCSKRKGNTKAFVCPYHDWSFNLDGELRGVPYKNGVDGKGGMSEAFDMKSHNLTPVRIATRNGVIFGTFSPSTPSLTEYFGPKITKYFDRVCDGRPLKIVGKMRHVVNANWKLQIENVKDPVHAAILHSFFTTFGIWRSDQDTNVIIDDSGKHSVLVSCATFSKTEKKTTKQSDFSLEDTRLIDHQREFEGGTGAVMTIWPNLIFLQQLNCLVMRHVKPEGPNRSIQTWTFFGYEDEPEALTERRLNQANLLGPSGLVTIDDNEVLAITQEHAANSPEIPMVYEFGQGDTDADYMVTEAAIRAFYNAYFSEIGDKVRWMNDC
ncbi:aromatic ring-hydroxylating oxygenase subunit alpha [Teredinibacter sp. KSP-S5-2]|uniref:aromatic ring-hydroxylating oxygenase subunit alpha n=1 Tax=Teredinibacter sp. KSP-S5-2 TaxID=3034506 RepID=UPI00293466FA|nr:Rieske 2Fe-2S domain-containing protein [Teredinibacter sp. KSP-S5-2]WNO10753.1 Rieske 2Fe-2S domain-containing protein [Teredinibacter sp. KSP-S5-2]